MLLQPTGPTYPEAAPLFSTCVGGERCGSGTLVMPTELTTVLKPLDVPFGWAPRALIEDPEISWKAKGLYTYLNSRPPGWQINPKDLTARATEGRDATRNAVRELRDKGWLVISKVRRGGKFAGHKWTLVSTPQLPVDTQPAPRPEKPAPEKPSPDKPAPDNPPHNKKNSNKNHSSSVASQPREMSNPGGPGAPQSHETSSQPASGPPALPDSATALLAGGRQVIAARFLPAVRDLRLGGIPDFPEGREVIILEQLLQKGYPPTEIELAIAGAIMIRDAGLLDWLRPKTPATLRCLYNTRKGATPFFNYCVNYARKREEARNGNGRPKTRSPRTIPVPVTVQLEPRSTDDRQHAPPA